MAIAFVGLASAGCGSFARRPADDWDEPMSEARGGAVDAASRPDRVFLIGDLVPVFAEADELSGETGEIPRGEIVSLIELEREWVRVARAGNRTAWVRRGDAVPYVGSLRIESCSSVLQAKSLCEEASLSHLPVTRVDLPFVEVPVLIGETAPPPLKTSPVLEPETEAARVARTVVLFAVVQSADADGGKQARAALQAACTRSTERTRADCHGRLVTLSTHHKNTRSPELTVSGTITSASAPPQALTDIVIVEAPKGVDTRRLVPVARLTSAIEEAEKLERHATYVFFVISGRAPWLATHDELRELAEKLTSAGESLQVVAHAAAAAPAEPPPPEGFADVVSRLAELEDSVEPAELTDWLETTITGRLNRLNALLAATAGGDDAPPPRPRPRVESLRVRVGRSGLPVLQGLVPRAHLVSAARATAALRNALAACDSRQMFLGRLQQEMAAAALAWSRTEPLERLVAGSGRGLRLPVSGHSVLRLSPEATWAGGVCWQEPYQESVKAAAARLEACQRTAVGGPAPDQVWVDWLGCAL